MTLFAELVGGPADGEAVRIGSGTQVIEVDLGRGGVAWYSSNGAWSWQYKGDKRVPPAGQRFAVSSPDKRKADGSSATRSDIVRPEGREQFGNAWLASRW